MDSGNVKVPDRNRFPFAAIVGQENVKKALMCALINPCINGVLISGETGSCKSTLARSINELSDEKKIVNLPLNATYERIVGTLDIEKAVLNGNKSHIPGILQEANRNILFVDDVNLLDAVTVATILDASETGSYLLEREGFSKEEKSDFTLVATINTAETELSPNQKDRFDICVMMESIEDREKRIQIIQKNLEFEKDPAEFKVQLLSETHKFQEKISNARDRMKYVMIPEGHLDVISNLVLEVAAEGHRGDIALSRVSKALAALDERDVVTLEDIQEAAELTLEHRSDNFSQNQNNDFNETSSDTSQETSLSPGNNNSSNSVENKMAENDSSQKSNDRLPDKAESSESSRVFEIGETFRVVDYVTVKKRMKIQQSTTKGKRKSLLDIDNSGKHISFRKAKGKTNDIALDATLRAAAPYQLSRKKKKKKKLAITIEKNDLHEKVRVKKKGNVILFLVDASGSMAARKRMITVKGAILSLLKDAYQKRDAVGMMAFHSDSAELLLPPTRSIDLAYHKLQELPTGGKTPLALGLSRSLELMMNIDLRSHGNNLVIVLISDCRANVPLDKGDAFDDALKVANQSLDMPIHFVVVDTETGYPRLGLAEKVSKALEGNYFKLENLDSEKIAISVKTVVHSDIRRDTFCTKTLV